LEEIDFSVSFKIDTVAIEMTGNKQDHFGNAKLMSFGFANQGFEINKQQKEIA
jgi:hypothetical protein